MARLTKLDKAFLELEKELEMMTRVGENEIVFNNVQALRESNKVLDEFYRKYANKDGQIELHEFRKFKRSTKLKRRLTEALYVATREDSKVTRQMLTDVFKRSYKGTQSLMISEFEKKEKKKVVGIKKTFSHVRSVDKKIEGLNWADRMDRDRKDVVKIINKQVVKGVEEGKLYHQVAEELADALDVNMNSALRIARTESHRVISDAKEESLLELHKAGVEANKKWISAKDERVRSTHRGLDGQVVGANEDFQSPSGASGPSPGNLGDPAEDINCRCIMVLTFDEKTMG